MGQMDEFYKGAELGMRSQAMDIQQEQFKTNLAERSRQFDLNHSIQVDSHNLREREFTHKQEQAVVENKYRIAATNRIGLLNKEANRLAEEEEDFGPMVTGYEISLQRWDGESNIPPLPAGLPTAQREQALKMRTDAMSAKLSGRMARAQEKYRTKMEDEYFKGFEWANTNAPQLITRDPQTGQFGYDYDQLLKVKGFHAQQQRYRSMMGMTGLTPTSTVTTDKLTGSQTQWKIPDKVKTLRQSVGEKNVSDFMTEDADGNPYFDRNAFDEFLLAIEGRPPSSSNVTSPDQIPDSSGLSAPTSGWRD